MSIASGTRIGPYEVKRQAPDSSNPLESLPCTVTYMEYFDLTLFFSHAIDDSINVGLVAVKVIA